MTATTLHITEYNKAFTAMPAAFTTTLKGCIIWYDHPEQKGFILGTAHPVKFPMVVQEAIGQTPTIPESLGALMKKHKTALLIPPEYARFKSTALEIFKKL